MKPKTSEHRRDAETADLPEFAHPSDCNCGHELCPGSICRCGILNCPGHPVVDGQFVEIDKAKLERGY